MNKKIIHIGMALLIGLGSFLPAAASASYADNQIKRAFKNKTPICWELSASDGGSGFLRVWIMQRIGRRFLWMGEITPTQSRPTNWRKLQFFDGSGTTVGTQLLMNGHDTQFEPGAPGITGASWAIKLRTGNLNGSGRLFDYYIDNDPADFEYFEVTFEKVACP